MFKLTIISFIIFTSLASSCEKEGHTQEEPIDCLEKLKVQIKALPPQTPQAVIWQYTYNGTTVYLVPAPCCDQFNPVYNSACEIICYPDGGITGKGDGKCNDFHATATDKRLVWKDSRSTE